MIDFCGAPHIRGPWSYRPGLTKEKRDSKQGSLTIGIGSCCWKIGRVWWLELEGNPTFALCVWKGRGGEGDRKRLAQTRFGVLISSSEERGRARREKTSAVMTAAVRDGGYSHSEKRTKAGQMDEKRGEGQLLFSEKLDRCYNVLFVSIKALSSLKLPWVT